MNDTYLNSTISNHFNTVVEQRVSIVASLQWRYVISCRSDLHCGALGSTPSLDGAIGSTTYWISGEAYSGPYARDDYHWQRPALHIV